MAKTTLTADLLPLLNEVTAILDKHKLITQQKLIELLTVRHAMVMDTKKERKFVLDAIHRHALQIMFDPPVED